MERDNEQRALDELDQAHGEDYDLGLSRTRGWFAKRVDGSGRTLYAATPGELDAAIRADTATRPMLRVAGGGKEDPVVRRRRFEAAHPEVALIPPGLTSSRWRAVVPAGVVPGEPAGTTIGAWQLEGLMDQLDVNYPPEGR